MQSQAIQKSILHAYTLHLIAAIKGVCEFTGLECENGALEWNTGVEYWSVQTKCL